MDLLAALAAEKDAAAKSARNSGLSPKGFVVFWALSKDPALTRAGVDAMQIVRDAEALLTRFPNARVNSDEGRRLRANLYRPLLKLSQSERTRVVDLIVATVLD
jgi:type I restriction enzyme, R subunit